MDYNQQASPLAIVIGIIVLLVVLFAIYQLTLAKHMPADQGTQPTGNISPAGMPPADLPATQNSVPQAEPEQNAVR